MTTQDFITELFCQVDDRMQELTKHPQANLWPSEVMTIGLLHAIKGTGNRAFYRWLSQNHRDMFPALPHRTRLFRLLRRHQDWCNSFLAKPSLLGVIDAYGIELIHPVREGRSERQIGKKGKSNHRWTWEANSVWYSTTWAWWRLGIATRPMSTIPASST